MTLFDLDKLKSQASNLEKEIGQDNFWANQREAQKKINLFNSLNERIKTFNDLNKIYNDLIETYLLVKDNYDEELHQMLSSEVEDLEKRFEEFSVEVLLNGEYDECNAIIDIHPGAGGTESQDWAEMLYRMYIRFAEKNNFKR